MEYSQQFLFDSENSTETLPFYGLKKTYDGNLLCVHLLWTITIMKTLLTMIKVGTEFSPLNHSNSSFSKDQHL